MTLPIDLATDETFAFVERALAGAGLHGPLRMLEIGCGSGHLAARLAAAGHAVVGIDASPEAVAEARGRGVAASVACFPELDSAGGFDCVLFTRSLHHVPPLDLAIARAHGLLAPHGLLVVDDFSHDAVDPVTAAWAFGVMAVLASLGLIDSEDWTEAHDPLAAWQAKHAERHRLHTEHAMLEATRQRFTLGPIEHVPYFYRYLCRYLDAHPRGYETAGAMLRSERALIEAHAIVPIGLHFSGRPG